MRKAAVAEWMLSLVVPRAAAAAIAGDLIEDAERHGGTWFWTSVAGTFVRQTARTLVRFPGPVLLLAGVSWFTYMGVGLVFAIASLIGARSGAFVINLLADHTGLGLVITSPVSAAAMRVMLEAVSLWALTPIIVGAMLARQARGFEVPLALVASACWPILALLVPFVGHDVRAADGLLISVPCFLAAVIRERRVQIEVRS
jgi:hypothetical protein